MATLAFSSAGSKIYIAAAAPTTYNATGFGALTWIEILEVTDIGAFGATFGLITHTPVNDPTTYKLKGISNSGTLALKGARAPAYPGQMALIAGAKVRAPVSIKIKLADATLVYSTGLVMGYQTMVGGAGVITSFDCNVELSGDLIDGV